MEKAGLNIDRRPSIVKFDEFNHARFAAIGIEKIAMVFGPEEMPYWSYSLYQIDGWWILCHRQMRDGFSLGITNRQELVDLLDKNINPTATGYDQWEDVRDYTQPGRRETKEPTPEWFMKYQAGMPRPGEDGSKYWGDHIMAFAEMVKIGSIIPVPSEIPHSRPSR